MPNTFSRIGIAAIAICLAALAPFAAAQSTPPPTTTTPPSSTQGSKSKAPQRIPLTIHVAPEGKEAEALTKLTTDALGDAKETDCPRIIETYETQLLPAAQKAKFPNNRADFVGIAHKSIGICQMKQGRYIDAEHSFEQALAQVKIWPGIDDHHYVDVLTLLSVAQLKQDHWKGAEDTAMQTAAFHERRIKDYDLAMSHQTGEVADNIRKAKEDEQRLRSGSLTGLAFLYQKDGDLDRAAITIEEAYQEALAGKLPKQFMDKIYGVGTHVAELRENRDDIAKWAARADTSAPPAGAAPDGAPKD
jgi:tetratricopeptide (TPR) repeat protein